MNGGRIVQQSQWHKNYKLIRSRAIACEFDLCIRIPVVQKSRGGKPTSLCRGKVNQRVEVLYYSLNKCTQNLESGEKLLVLK